jgi:hypothetical protein
MAGAVHHYRTIKARRPSEKANRLIIATRWSPWRIVRSAARSPTSLAGAAHHRGCGVARAPERIAMYRRAGFSCPGPQSSVICQAGLRDRQLHGLRRHDVPVTGNFPDDRALRSSPCLSARSCDYFQNALDVPLSEAARLPPIQQDFYVAPTLSTAGLQDGKRQNPDPARAVSTPAVQQAYTS